MVYFKNWNGNVHRLWNDLITPTPSTASSTTISENLHIRHQNITSDLAIKFKESEIISEAWKLLFFYTCLNSKKKVSNPTSCARHGDLTFINVQKYLCFLKNEIVSRKRILLTPNVETQLVYFALNTIKDGIFLEKMCEKKEKYSY